MTIDSIDDVDTNFAYWNLPEKTALWNGRKVEILNPKEQIDKDQEGSTEIEIEISWDF